MTKQKTKKTTEKETQKQVKNLSLNLKKTIWPNLFLASLISHILTLRYVKSEFKSLGLSGKLNFDVSVIIHSLEFENSAGIYIALLLSIFLLLTAICAGIIQLKSSKK